MSQLTSQPDVYYIDELKHISTADTQIGPGEAIQIEKTADHDQSIQDEWGHAQAESRDVAYTAIVERAYQQGENDAVARLSRLLAKRRAMTPCFQACIG